MAVNLVVGAGVAGCAVAATLAATGDQRVIWCEAGGLQETAVPTVRRVGGPVGSYRTGHGWGGTSLINGGVVVPERSPDLAATVDVPSTPATIGPLGAALAGTDARFETVSLLRRNGVRLSMFDALVPSVPSNVERVDAAVARVLVDGSSAVGVELADGDRIVADRVVVCAGVIGSPRLLAASGLDLPGIGEGLIEQPSVALTVAGPATPDARCSLSAMERMGDGFGELLVAESVGGGEPYGALLVSLATPRSRGRVTAERVELDLFSDPADIDALSALVERAIGLLDTAGVGPVYIDRHGTTTAALVDRSALERYVVDAFGGVYHAVGSCSRVVDQRGAVAGYEGLYVADAAAMSAAPVGNMMLGVIDHARRVAVGLG